jgi:hypothetical protein
LTCPGATLISAGTRDGGVLTEALEIP